ncbi:hypothetical protein NPIL_239851 [Nephila pilipes]|uniref:Uncharacterized protein n=1 Tax=Nephila pilipes TaxID=299642 RepID=A0A8X6TJJ2_NEPPI|nr:hypothetical protein NPIL_239851 [Nephila pilipes]
MIRCTFLPKNRVPGVICRFIPLLPIGPYRKWVGSWGPFYGTKGPKADGLILTYPGGRAMGARTSYWVALERTFKDESFDLPFAPLLAIGSGSSLLQSGFGPLEAILRTEVHILGIVEIISSACPRHGKGRISPSVP